MLLATIGSAVAFSLLRVGSARPPLFALILIGVLGILASAFAWIGFQYRFSSNGVEIRMLGLLLQSIPKESIVNYAIESWSLIRGYGIRGVGKTRAYVWCNKVVHIKTSTGDVFLGHNDPQRLVHDLDSVTGVVNRG